MKRLCPMCGTRTEEARCPNDGTATLVLAQNPDSRLAEGAEVNGRYRIGKMIGQGGFGAVYKATSLATGQAMAVKVLGISLDSDESELIQRFYAEAQITAALKHPNTIRVFDFGQTEGGALYIAMELLSGQALNELLRERRRDGTALSQEETTRIATQTLRSLAEAHMNGLVHRDLKPHNIFLNEVAGDEPVVKVLDFGIAKRLGSNLTGTGQAFGTPTYMSPEQAQNRPIDARSDLYSLGVVLYQCIAASCPFEGDNPLAVLLSHVTDAPPDLREKAQMPVSQEFVDIIHRALAKDPNDRFDDAITMRRALEKCARAPSEEEWGRKAVALPDEEQGNVDTEERTAAYIVGGGPSATPPGAPPAAPPPGPPLAPESSPPAPTSATEEVYDALPKQGGGAGKWFGLVVLLLAIAGGAWFATSGGGAEKPAAPPVPVAAADTASSPAPAAAPDTASAEPDTASADTGAADTGAAADTAPPKPVMVELKTQPSGATVKVDGKELGKTPLKLEVDPAKALRATLVLKGHRDKEVLVVASDAPSREVALNALPKRPKPTVRRPKRPKRRQPTRPAPKVKSALEERL